MRRRTCKGGEGAGGVGGRALGDFLGHQLAHGFEDPLVVVESLVGVGGGIASVDSDRGPALAARSKAATCASSLLVSLECSATDPLSTAWAWSWPSVSDSRTQLMVELEKRERAFDERSATGEKKIEWSGKNRLFSLSSFVSLSLLTYLSKASKPSLT